MNRVITFSIDVAVAFGAAVTYGMILVALFRVMHP